MNLDGLCDNRGARKPRKRLGRGIGSGLGKTSGRGHKGQKARSGVAVNGFEGGQMPLYRRLPKRGFCKPNRVRYAELNLGKLQRAIDAKRLDISAEISGEMLVAAGVLRRLHGGVRLLAKGNLLSNVRIVVSYASPASIEAVSKFGGVVRLLPKPEVWTATPYPSHGARI